MCETFPARLERGAGLPNLDRLPYFPEQAIEMLKPFDTIVIAGAKKPVAFFGYPDFPSQLIPEGIEGRDSRRANRRRASRSRSARQRNRGAGFGRDAGESIAS